MCENLNIARYLLPYNLKGSRVTKCVRREEKGEGEGEGEGGEDYRLLANKITMRQGDVFTMLQKCPNFDPRNHTQFLQAVNSAKQLQATLNDTTPHVKREINREVHDMRGFSKIQSAWPAAVKAGFDRRKYKHKIVFDIEWEEDLAGVMSRPPAGWDDLLAGGAVVQQRWAYGGEELSTLEQNVASR